jgi:hypothetical protein
MDEGVMQLRPSVSGDTLEVRPRDALDRVDVEEEVDDVDRTELCGYVAEFESAHHIVAAATKTREAGYTRIDAYSPLPVEGLADALGFRDMYVPLIMLVGGILGGLGGFGLLYFTQVIDYPLNIGGRPVEPTNFGWAHFIPITFECIVLLAALSGIAGMFMLNGLPQPYHPLFDTPGFDRATSDRFFLSIEMADPKFDVARTQAFLESLNPVRVSEVYLRR